MAEKHDARAVLTVAREEVKKLQTMIASYSKWYSDSTLLYSFRFAAFVLALFLIFAKFFFATRGHYSALLSMFLSGQVLFLVSFLDLLRVYTVHCDVVQLIIASEFTFPRYGTFRFSMLWFSVLLLLHIYIFFTRKTNAVSSVPFRLYLESLFFSVYSPSINFFQRFKRAQNCNTD